MTAERNKAETGDHPVARDFFQHQPFHGRLLKPMDEVAG